MQIALEQARQACESGEVPVGAVLVHRQNREIIAAGHNMVEAKRNPLLHAEMLVIEEACAKTDSKNLCEYDIYVTLEPCAMCASAISHARIGRLFYAASDKKQGAVENGVRFFASNSCFHRPEIFSGISSEKSQIMLQNFFKRARGKL